MHSYNFYHSENFCVRNLGFSTQVLRNVSLFLEQEEKMDKLINSEMPAYVHLEGKISARFWMQWILRESW